MAVVISRVQAEALATAICKCRDDWERPGIMAAIGKARDLGSAAAIGAALFRLAENRDMRTPALLSEPGAHWGGTTVASRRPPTMCPDHPTERAWACRPCADLAADSETAKAAIRKLHTELKGAKR